jgi:hypothetical protein
VITDPNKINYADTVVEGLFRNNVFRFYLPEPGFQLLNSPQFGTVTKNNDYEYQYLPTGIQGSFEQLVFQKENKKTVFQLSILNQQKKNQFLVDDVVYLNKNTSRLFSVTTNDNSTAGNPAITSFTQPSSGIVSLNADRSFTYTSTLDFEGITSFEYTACNASGCETAKAFLYVSDFLPREDLNPIFRVAEGRSVVIPYDIPVQDYDSRF